jgi:hypothetical protein
MARITPDDAQGWAESTKLTLSSLDASLLNQIEEEVIGRLNSVYTTSGWTDSTNTPALVKVIISKLYVAWFYDRQYSENQSEGNDYAILLRANAEMLMTGLIDGTIDLPDVPVAGSGLGPAFYPNDASSAMEPTPEDPSLGPAKFSMGKVF